MLVCHDPVKLARRLGAAPSPLDFGDPAAQAGARHKLKIDGLGDLPVDGGRPLGPKVKGPGVAAAVAVRKDLPARAISIKNKHLLVVYSTPTRGFTAAVSVFRGTPPPKPSNCKSVSNDFGARIRPRWAEPNG